MISRDVFCTARNFFARAAITLLFLACGGSLLHAQFQRGTILGTVTDPSGGAVAQAKVTLTNLGTNEDRTATTNDRGDYEFPLLLPGQYRVTTEASGFQTKTISGVGLEVNQTARIDVPLLIGSVSQVVEAKASVQLLQTDTAETGGVITNKQIVDLPLNGRDYLQLARLIPGAIPSRAGATAGQKGVSRSVNVAGARDTSVSYLLDGIDTNDIVFQTPSVTPSVDAIQEFKLIADTYSAEFGRGATQIITALKSGTNQFHGSLYEFNRNNFLGARNFFQPGAIGKLNYNEFGATLGGPVTIPKLYHGKDRTFFFINYEGSRQRTGGAGFAFVPTAAQRSGDFSAPGSQIIYQPSTDSTNIHTRQPFPGNKIPSSSFDPLAAKVLNLYPLPNFNRPGQNYSTNVPGIDDSNSANARIDQHISDKDTFFGRYSILDRFNPVPSVLPYNGIANTIRGQNVALNWIHIFTPNVINEVRAGFNRSKYYTTAGASPSANPAKDLFGFTNTISDPGAAYGIPNFGLSNGFTSLGPGTQYPANSVVQTYQYVDNFTVIRGSQTLKTGIDFRRTRLSSVVGNNARGSVNFTGQYTDLPSNASTTGNSVADLLLGDAQSIAWSFGDGFATDYTNLYSGYFQDDWRLTSKLTLNLGIRYEYASPFVEKLNRFTILDTSQAGKASGGRLLLADTSDAFVPGQGIIDLHHHNSRSLISPDRNNWAPRVGLAYRPFAKTVFHAGGGLFYDVQEGNEAQFLRNNPPFLFAQNLAADPNIPNIHLTGLFPTATGPSGTPGSIQPFSLDITNRVPYVAQWNATIQRELLSNLILDVGYTGSAGKHLLRRSNFQQGANILANPANPTPLSQRVDYPNFSNNYIVGSDNGGSSTYHGLITKLERQFSNGFSVLFSYSYSKALTDASSSSNYDNTPSNPQCRCDFRDEKGPAAFDIRHRAVLSYTYVLPFGQGKLFLNRPGWTDKLVGGWQLNGITSWQSGPPFTINTPGDNAVIGSSSQRPNVVGDPLAGIGGSVENRGVNPGTYAFNRLAFVLPPQYQLGDLGKNTLYAPGLQNWDFSLFKNTSITERLNLQLRGEFFNVFNHPNFGVPGRTLNQPTFGVITSAGPARVVQIGAKLIF